MKMDTTQRRRFREWIRLEYEGLTSVQNTDEALDRYFSARHALALMHVLFESEDFSSSYGMLRMCYDEVIDRMEEAIIEIDLQE